VGTAGGRPDGGWHNSPTFHTEVVSGPPCLFSRHSQSSLDLSSPRYADTDACVQCVNDLIRPGLSLDVNDILPAYRLHYLEFWSMVDVRGPDECWPHQSRRLDKSSRHWAKTTRLPTWLLRTAQTRIAPYRLATWFSWGDIGYLDVTPVCGDKTCCNPLHLRVKGVPHFHHAATLNRIDLQLRAERRQGEVAYFLEQARRERGLTFERIRQVDPERIDRLLRTIQGSAT
jgi:hypothetical protein